MSTLPLVSLSIRDHANITPEPRKRTNVQLASQEDLTGTRRDSLPPSMLQNSLQKVSSTSTSRHGVPTMSPSPSHDGNYRSLSPTRRHDSHIAAQTNGAIVPALLMPPSTTWLGSFRLGWYRFTHRFGAPTPPYFRFTLFILKMTLLAQTCWPNSFNMAAGGGLIMAAAVDLSWTLEMWITGLLLLLHLGFIFTLHSRAQLCQAGPELWEWHSPYHLNDIGVA